MSDTALKAVETVLKSDPEPANLPKQIHLIHFTGRQPLLVKERRK
jgi:hypothetical protein